MEILNDDEAELPLLSRKHVNHTFDAPTAVYCDIHDLLAVINTASNDVTIYRAVNGQTAFHIKHPDPYSEAKPTLLSWKPDGTLLGVGWDDGSCCLCSGENGKLVWRTSTVHRQQETEWQLDLSPPVVDDDDEAGGQSRAPTCIAWTKHQCHDLGSLSRSTSLLKMNGELTTDDWFAESPSNEPTSDLRPSGNGFQDLVDSITTLDVAKVLPGLSALPSHGLRAGSEAGKFTTQASMNKIFSTAELSSNQVDALLLCDRTDQATLLLDDSVAVGKISARTQDALHASHPSCPAQVLMSRPGPDTLELQYIDLPLKTLSGPLLHVVATNTKRLQSLMAYVTHTVRCIQHDFSSGLSLPTRILNNFREELQQKEGEPAIALYELCMTGRFTPTMTEWLSEVVKDTLRKRWEQAVSEMYDHILNHIFMHLLPALDRLSIIASTLRSHAQLHQGTSAFDVHAALFDELEDMTDAVRLVAEHAQLIAMTEMRQFQAFVRWLRVMIDVASAGPGTKSAIDTEQRDILNVDFQLVGAYIISTMSKSGLSEHIEQLQDMHGGLDKELFFDHPIVKQLNREQTVDTLRKSRTNAQRRAEDAHDVVCPAFNMPALTARLAAQARLCLEGITTWQQRMLSKQMSPEAPVVIDGAGSVLDVKMFPGSLISGDLQSVVQALVLEQSYAGIRQLSLWEVTRRSDKQSHVTRFDVPTNNARVVHAQIFNYGSYLVLLQWGTGDSARAEFMLVQHNRSHDDVWTSQTLHNFTSEQALSRPKHFLGGGRPGKRVVVVFGDDGWQVLDLRSAEHGAAAAAAAAAAATERHDGDLMEQ